MRRINWKNMEWQFVFNYGKDFTRYDNQGWREVKIGVVKLKELPPEGVEISHKYYQGFIFSFGFWFPIEVKSWR